MASQIAGLLLESDLQELTEIVDRWIAEAPTQGMRHHYTEFGAKLIMLKRSLADLPRPPQRPDLEAALDMMLKLAAQRR